MTLVFGTVIMNSVMNMKKSIGLRIKEFRSRVKMTQGVLAEKVGVTNRAVSNWESGTNGVDVDLIPAICAALNVSPNELLGTPSKAGLSEEATAVAKSFDTLDAPGKAAVMAALESQKQRISEYGALTHKSALIARRMAVVDGVNEAEIQMKYQAAREREELEEMKEEVEVE